MTLVDSRGNPISSAMFAKKEKISKPLLGELGNPWSGIERPNTKWFQQNTLQFDTSRLTIEDYRMMTDHYQVNSSLTLLSFMLHQMEWKVECDNVKIAKHCEDNLGQIWTRVVRALSQAFIFGYSPNALRWENDPGSGRLIISKVLDFRPEDCRVHWKEVEGVVKRDTIGGSHKRKVKIFDGIDQLGHPTIPVSNSLWYPLLMRNGDYYGKKLLNAAFQPWFFSNVLHLYANRYYERFGEPVIVSRAPFEEEKDVGNGQKLPGNLLMAGLATMVRNGSTVVLPNDRAQNGLDGVGNFEYTMEYLESQMRGADFERMLTRYDQEISLALFTPLLMMNAADGGSFNLGVVHTQMYLAMIRAIADDWKEYIDRYLLRPMAQQNFGPNAKLPQIKFQKLGKVPEETGRALLQQLLTSGNDGHAVNVNLEEASQALGLTLEQGEELNLNVADPNAIDPTAADPAKKDAVVRPAEPKRKDTRVGRPEREGTGKGTQKKGASVNSSAVAASIATRLSGQFLKSYRDGVQPSDFQADIGYHRQLSDLFASRSDAVNFTDDAEGWVNAYYEIFHASDNPLESEMRDVLTRGLVAQIEGMLDA
ncbi:portal protein [Rhodococcus phage Mbo2]|uniref:Portal protein n=1 Tax=Rhodococcus phage Mbo2 TaxID=2936911 RepID=A0A9E7LH70_9CAUD|nr:portal protein [Rhodococcus phage Mbo2]